AADGIRGDLVTGVQTCALPISPSLFAPSSVVPLASPVPSVFGGSLFPAAVEAFAGSLAGAGAAGSGCWAWGFASLPSEGAVTFSAPLVVSAGPPGTTIATIPGPVPSIRDGFPPVRMSPPSSLSGDIVGVPDLAAAYNSCLGVVCTSATGFKTSGACFSG